MPRRMLAPIIAVKHYVQTSNATIAASGIINIQIANAVAQEGISAASDVTEGSIVKAVFIEDWLLGNDTTTKITQFTLVIEKVPAGATLITFAQLSSGLASYPNKKNILYSTQGVLSESIDGGVAVPIFRSWVKIPKGKQRMGLGDKIIVSIAALGGSLRHCGLSTYKEYK